ncbi:MAG TPA: hypothetical protein VLW50_24030 [Streptosporangiaceae bacterium]|nr:hypothetical protein [Streptosporangiaceae bacterium]
MLISILVLMLLGSGWVAVAVQQVAVQQVAVQRVAVHMEGRPD